MVLSAIQDKYKTNGNNASGSSTLQCSPQQQIPSINPLLPNEIRVPSATDLNQQNFHPLAQMSTNTRTMNSAVVGASTSSTYLNRASTLQQQLQQQQVLASRHPNGFANRIAQFNQPIQTNHFQTYQSNEIGSNLNGNVNYPNYNGNNRQPNTNLIGSIGNQNLRLPNNFSLATGQNEEFNETLRRAANTAFLIQQNNTNESSNNTNTNMNSHQQQNWR